MTSGIFQQTPVSEIWVDRAKRQRRELPDLSELQKSISEIGLINPVVITRELELVAGECRWVSCKALGWSHIATQYVDELDEATLRQIELEENVKRNALPWQDECKAVAEYHSLRESQEPSWTQEDTATALGLSESSVTKKLSVAREIAAGNKMVLEAPKYSTAHRLISRQESRKDEEALLAIAPRPKTESGTAPDEPADVILNTDFNEWAPTYAGSRFNFIHCDFPYGINADKFNQGAAASHGGYSDSAADYWQLCNTLADNIDRVCSESCHIMFWFSMHYYQETLDFFSERTDFRIDSFPLIWTKSDNVGILPDPERGPRRIYETCLFGSRGDRKIVRPVSNSFSSPSERIDHMSVKPASMLTQFFRMFVDSNTSMLDPTAGSGSSLRAATSLAAGRVVGLERDPEFAARANLAYRKAQVKPDATAHDEAGSSMGAGMAEGGLDPGADS